MMTIKTSALGLVLAVAVTGAACGGAAAGDPGSNPTPTPNNPQLMSSDAKRVGAGVSQGAQAFRSPAHAFAAGCPDITNVGVDSDLDGVSSYTVMQYTDCSMQTAWGQGVVNGNEALVDNNDAANDFNLTHAVDLTIALADSAQTIVQVQAANTGSHSGSDWELTEATDNTISTADGSSEHDQIALSKIYTPTAAWMPGQALVAGTYSVSGAYEITITSASAGDSDVAFTVSTLDPLTLDPSCPTLIVAGTIEAASSDASATTVADITWTGCDASNVDLVPLP